MLAILIIVVLILLVFAAVLLRERTSGKSGRYPYPYQQLNELLSKAELSFFGVLRQAVGEHGIVFCKVRIADVLTTKRGLNNSQRQTALNKIQSKHFDFVICSNDSARPLVAIELDDASHRRKDRIARDEFVNGATKAASLPLLRIPAKHAYSIAQLKAQLTPCLELPADSNPGSSGSNPKPAAEKPSCPKCGSGMVRRERKSGPLAGEQFWGCAQYPGCRGTAPVEA